MKRHLYTPDPIDFELLPHEIMGFGSNKQGIHGGGAAKFALDKLGAKWGQARGLQGQSYGIITKDLKTGLSMDLNFIKKELLMFYLFAYLSPQNIYYLTKVGTGLSGIPIDVMKNLWLSVEKFYHGKQMLTTNIIIPIEFAEHST